MLEPSRQTVSHSPSIISGGKSRSILHSPSVSSSVSLADSPLLAHSPVLAHSRVLVNSPLLVPSPPKEDSVTMRAGHTMPQYSPHVKNESESLSVLVERRQGVEKTEKTEDLGRSVVSDSSMPDFADESNMAEETEESSMKGVHKTGQSNAAVKTTLSRQVCSDDKDGSCCRQSHVQQDSWRGSRTRENGDDRIFSSFSRPDADNEGMRKLESNGSVEIYKSVDEFSTDSQAVNESPLERSNFPVLMPDRKQSQPEVDLKRLHQRGSPMAGEVKADVSPRRVDVCKCEPGDNNCCRPPPRFSPNEDLAAPQRETNAREDVNAHTFQPNQYGLDPNRSAPNTLDFRKDGGKEMIRADADKTHRLLFLVQQLIGNQNSCGMPNRAPYIMSNSPVAFSPLNAVASPGMVMPPSGLPPSAIPCPAIPTPQRFSIPQRFPPPSQGYPVPPNPIMPHGLPHGMPGQCSPSMMYVTPPSPATYYPGMPC